MDDAQVSGSTSTYARRYAISSLCCIDDNQDFDSMDNRNTVTEDQKREYQELLKSGAYEGDIQKMNKWWKGFSTKEQAETGLKVMKNHIDKVLN